MALGKEMKNGTYIPKSAITISLSVSFVLYRMFSGLVKNVHVNMWTNMMLVENTYLRSRWTISWSCRYLTPDNIDLYMSSDEWTSQTKET